MSAPTVEEKADRLLADGRLTVDQIRFGPLGPTIIASCISSDGEKTYRLGYDPRRSQWRCTCPVTRGRCSHLAALKKVTHVPAVLP